MAVDEGLRLMERARTATARSLRLADDSGRLRGAVRSVVLDARHQRSLARRTRAARAAPGTAPAPRGPAWFSVSGFIDGEAVWAVWDPVGGTFADIHPEARRRAEVVVALGDEFRLQDLRVPASLDDGALPALLTVMRAIGHVSGIEMGATGTPGPGCRRG